MWIVAWRRWFASRGHANYKLGSLSMVYVQLHGGVSGSAYAMAAIGADTFKLPAIQESVGERLQARL
jgi:hypothetical protein